jgi:endonuclease YncB( thermonuclease family)
LKDETLHIRIAGVDAPEAAHFGKLAQPGSAEALAFLKGLLEGKTIWTKLIRKDQYSRVVCALFSHARRIPIPDARLLQVGLPYLPPRFLPSRFFKGKPVAFEMLRAGHATTYEQAGAEYGPWGKAKFLRLEAIAKSAISLSLQNILYSNSC